MSLLNRTIFWDLLKVFVLALIGLTGILVLAVVVVEAQRRGLGPMQVLSLIPFVVPTTLPYTLPTTTLFATCVVYGRLAHDNEILAIRSAGIHLMLIIRPALFLGVITSIITAVLFFHLIPTSYHMMKSVFLNDLEGLLYSYLKREGQFSHPKLDYVIYVKRVEDRKLIDALFMHRAKKGKRYDAIAQAQEAELRVDNAHEKVYIHMRHCTITTTDKAGQPNVVIVKDRIETLDFPPNFKQDKKIRRSDMTWLELNDEISSQEKKIDDLDKQIKVTSGLLALRKGPSSLPKHLENLRFLKKHVHQSLASTSAEQHKRLVLAAGCFCFVLVGCPVGIWFSRSDYLSAFVTCFLPIVLLYYPLLICGDNIARSGTIAPAVAMWPANLIMVVIAVVLYRKLLKN